MSRPIIHALPQLVEAGVITAGTAEDIKAYYQQQSQGHANRANVIFGIIGAVLVGLGIILIVAHNWDELSRPVKVMLSFLPLLIGQALCAFALLKKRGNVTWSESSACFLFFAVGVSIALVAQVYNIPGNSTEFIFTWMLLSFPLIYIMPSSMISLLYLGGITIYAVQADYGSISLQHYHYWWLLLLMLPHYVLLVLKNPAGNFTFFHHWMLPLSLTICLGTLLTTADGYEPIAYIGLFAVFYFIGTAPWFPSAGKVNANGFAFIGSLGTMIIFFMASFKDFWNNIAGHDAHFSIAATLGLLLPAAFAGLLFFSYLRRNKGNEVNLFICAFPAFYMIYFIGRYDPFIAAVLMNALVLGTAIVIVLRGLKLNNLAVLNYGLLVVAILVTCRFFDTDLSFVMRGLLFVAVGAGFFFANNRLMKKRKKAL